MEEHFSLLSKADAPWLEVAKFFWRSKHDPAFGKVWGDNLLYVVGDGSDVAVVRKIHWTCFPEIRGISHSLPMEDAEEKVAFEQWMHERPQRGILLSPFPYCPAGAHAVSFSDKVVNQAADSFRTNARLKAKRLRWIVSRVFSTDSLCVHVATHLYRHLTLSQITSSGLPTELQEQILSVPFHTGFREKVD